MYAAVSQCSSFLLELDSETVVICFAGLSDPFIEFSLMPPWAFGLSKPHKIQTSKKKKTVNPVFNEEFMM